MNAHFLATAILFSVCLVFQNLYALYEVPEEKDTLHTIGELNGSEELPIKLKILVWNVLKGKRESWHKDFSILSNDKNLILLQEAIIDGQMENTLTLEQKFLWLFAGSFFERRGFLTGVSIGGLGRPRRSEYIRSLGTEPLIGTPKITLMNEYSIKEREQTLLVITTHALNLAGINNFKEQVENIVEVASGHVGPIIFGGDFNTWNGMRLRWLDQCLLKIGLKPVRFQEDERKLKLDHVYVRGLEVEKAEVLNHFNSSDHKPLDLTLWVTRP